MNNIIVPPNYLIQLGLAQVTHADAPDAPAAEIPGEPIQYYAVCNTNGPISVRIPSSSEDDAVQWFASNYTRDWIDGAYTDVEDDMNMDGCAEMDEDEFDDALREAGLRPIVDLEPVCNAHAGTVAHVAGGWYLWRHLAATP